LSACLRERGEVPDVDEHDRHLHLLAGQVRALLQDVLGHLGVDAERLADPLALGQSLHHGVEAELEAADLGAVVDRHADVELPLAHALQRAPHRLHGIGRRLRGHRDCHQADGQARTAEDDHRYTELGPGGLRLPDQCGDADDDHPRQRQPCAHHPRQYRPCRHPGNGEPFGCAALQGTDRRRAQQQLGQQV